MFKPKIWLRLGALAVASSATASSKPIHATETVDQSKEVVGQYDSAGTVVAQRGTHGAEGEGGEGGEAGSSRPAVAPKVAPQQQQKSRAKRRRGEGGERGFRPRSDRAETRGRQLGEGGERGEGGEQGANTRYIFGLTEGADTERAREKELENDTQGRLIKRSGTYTALQNKTEAEFCLTNNLLVEFGLFSSYQRIQDVPDFEDRNAARFDGAFAEVKYRFLDRNVHGLGMAFSVEPEWHRYSGLTGRFENSYAAELKLYVDKELIPGRLFVAGNLVYEPEAVLAKNSIRTQGNSPNGSASPAFRPRAQFLGRSRQTVRWCGSAVFSELRR